MKVVGLTGTIGSGKEIVKEALEKRFNSYSVALSSLLRDEYLRKRKIKIDRKVKQDLGNELRKQYGADVLAKIAVGFMQKDKELLIINGIRNPAEAEFLRKKFGKNFKLIAVDAPREVRFERILKRNRGDDPKTFEEFVILDKRDQGKNEPEYGQQTRKCIEQADFVLKNDGSLEEVQKKVEEIINSI